MPERPRQTILVVDDEEANRYVVARHLRKAGFRVVEAGTGMGALAQMAEELPDLVLLDIQLPDVNGREVCRLIKSDPVLQHVIVVHASAAFVSPEDRVEGLDCGADGYLTYPLNPSELVATIRALLRIREAEQRAQEAASQLETTFNAINDGVSLLSRDGKIVRCNQTMAALMDRPLEGVIGRSYEEVLRESLGIGDLPALSATVFEGPRRAMEVSGGDRWFRVTIDPVRDDAGLLTGAVHVLTDITLRKRLEAELQRQADELSQANRAKDEFLAMLGHELRNPLAPILNSVAVLRERGPKDPLLERAGEVVERQVHHMVRLVDDLLDVSRITRGTIELRRERVNLIDVVRQTAQNARPNLDAQGHRFTVALPAGPVWVDADATRVEQILSNLLTNAAKFTEAAGEIGVALTADHSEAVITVTDTGRGIPPEMLGHIFDLFTQVTPSLDRAQGGLGLGLTLVRRLVELHGGSITAHSAGRGHGAEFQIRLPVLPPLEQGAAAPAPTAAPDSNRKRILIVEDNADSRETLRDLLQLWGHDVIAAADGTAGLEMLENCRLDVALIDIGLPGLSGYEVSRRIREVCPDAQLRLVALTGYGQPDDRRRALEAGFDDHLVKPLDPEMLRRLLAYA